MYTLTINGESRHLPAPCSVAELLFWRALVGIGLGAQWSAGATLVAESWGPENRGKALSLMQSGWACGYMLAAAITPYILEHYNWRVLFLVGVLPALLTVWVCTSPRTVLGQSKTAEKSVTSVAPATAQLIVKEPPATTKSKARLSDEELERLRAQIIETSKQSKAKTANK